MGADAVGSGDGPTLADALGTDAIDDPGGAVCAAASDVTAGGTFSGTTLGSSNDLSPPTGNGCPAGGVASGPDVVYFVQPGTAGTVYNVTVVPKDPDFDPMLYATPACDFSLGCAAGTVLNGPDEPESMVFVAGSQPVYIVVDGELGTAGAFELTVTPQ